jgi:hypothetical protein
MPVKLLIGGEFVEKGCWCPMELPICCVYWHFYMSGIGGNFAVVLGLILNGNEEYSLLGCGGL